MKKVYRVECNFGNKYFENAVEAFAYFHEKTIQGFKVEIFLRITEKTHRYFKVTEELLDSSD